MTDRELLTAAVSTLHGMTALQLGSPEALADCRRRIQDAQRMANRAVEWAEHEATFPDLPAEYDPTDDEGGD